MKRKWAIVHQSVRNEPIVQDRCELSRWENGGVLITVDFECKPIVFDDVPFRIGIVVRTHEPLFTVEMATCQPSQLDDYIANCRSILIMSINWNYLLDYHEKVPMLNI